MRLSLLLCHWRRSLCALCCLLLWSVQAHAFDNQSLQQQLRQHPVVRGEFVQEKHLRALPKPLTSRGQFVLAQEFGLLWLLRSPLQQDFRITAEGVARRTPQGWQASSGGSASERQNRLTLALLSGDESQLSRDFDSQLTGTAQAWQLTLTPKSSLLQHIFQRIELSGAQGIERIEIFEAQGDRTLMRLQDTQQYQALTEQERHDLRN